MSIAWKVDEVKRSITKPEGTSNIMIRVPPWLHTALKKLAHKKEASLNELCVGIFMGFANKEGYEDAAGQSARTRDRETLRS